MSRLIKFTHSKNKFKSLKSEEMKMDIFQQSPVVQPSKEEFLDNNSIISEEKCVEKVENIFDQEPNSFDQAMEDIEKPMTKSPPMKGYQRRSHGSLQFKYASSIIQFLTESEDYVGFGDYTSWPNKISFVKRRFNDITSRLVFLGLLKKAWINELKFRWMGVQKRLDKIQIPRSSVPQFFSSVFSVQLISCFRFFSVQEISSLVQEEARKRNIQLTDSFQRRIGTVISILRAMGFIRFAGTRSSRIYYNVVTPFSIRSQAIYQVEKPVKSQIQAPIQLKDSIIAEKDPLNKKNPTQKACSCKKCTKYCQNLYEQCLQFIEAKDHKMKLDEVQADE